MGGEQSCGGEGEKPCTPVVQLQRASGAACLLQAHPTGEEATQASIREDLVHCALIGF